MWGTSTARGAMETEDTYLRLDETLAKLLRFLEKAAGRGG